MVVTNFYNTTDNFFSLLSFLTASDCEARARFILPSTILHRSDGLGAATFSPHDMVDKKLDENIGQFCSVTGASYDVQPSSVWRSILI